MLTAADLTAPTLTAIAALAGYRPDKPVSFEEVTQAVLDGLDTDHDETYLRRRIGFAFRNKREGYCGKQEPLTVQMGRGEWALTLAGVRAVREWEGHTNTDRIITLNMGLGRDSIAMLNLLIEDGLVAEGTKLTKDDIDCVVFSNLGREWEHTYDQLPRIKALCEEHGIRFIVLDKPSAEEAMADHALRDEIRATGKKARIKPSWFKPWAWKRAWKRWADRTWTSIEEKAAAGGYHLRSDILTDFMSRSTIASRRGDCTDNHKIQPIRKLVRDLCMEKFDIDCNTWGRMVRNGERLPHLTLIGIAADEATRAENGGNSPSYITEAYPLIEMGITKPGEAEVLERNGFGDVRKSGCYMCPFQGLGWFYALRERFPEKWDEVVEYERVALERNPKMFVTGSRPLPEQVERWAERNPNADINAILDKAYSRCSETRGVTGQKAA